MRIKIDAQSLRKRPTITPDDEDMWAGSDAQVPDSPADLAELTNA